MPGNWYDSATRQTLRPDMDHPPPLGPHWDWRARDGSWYRWFPDNSVEPKKPPKPHFEPLSELVMGEDAMDYMVWCLRDERGLCAKVGRDELFGGKLFAVVPQGVGREEAKAFSAGRRIPMQHVITWLTDHLRARLAEDPARTVFVQDVWVTPSERGPQSDTPWFAHRDCLYYPAETEKLDYAEADRLIHEPVSFQLVGFISDYTLPRSVLATHEAPDNVMDALAEAVIEVFVGAYDQEGLVVWAKDD